MDITGPLRELTNSISEETMIVAEPLNPGEHCLLRGCEFLDLVVRDDENSVLQKMTAPSLGWTYRLLEKAELELMPKTKDVVHEIYLGEIWIGSSEC